MHGQMRIINKYARGTIIVPTFERKKPYSFIFSSREAIMQRVVLGVVLVAALAISTPASAQVSTLRQSSGEAQSQALLEPRSPRLENQFYRAKRAFESGSSLMEAKVRLDRVLSQRANDVEARKLRAKVLLAMERPAAARQDARHAVKLRPEDGEAHLLLAESAQRAGEDDVARQALERAAGQVVNDAAFHVRLSWNATQLQLLDKAEAYARTALALDPTLADAYYQLARVFVRKDQLDKAATILTRGLDRALLSPSVLKQDSLLRRVTEHPELRGRL